MGMAIGWGQRGSTRNRKRALATIGVLIGHGAILWAILDDHPRLAQDRVTLQTTPVALWSVPPMLRPKGRTASQRKARDRAVRTAGLTPTENAPVVSLPVAAKPAGTDEVAGSDLRHQLASALQSHALCVSLVQSGKPLPATCHMNDLSQRVPLGPPADAALQAAAARVEYRLKYKTTPGNSDYWKRVAAVPTDSDLRLCSARPGTYTNAKDQRVWRCWAPDPANGVATP
jgi:hypothetical protein